MDKIKFIFRQLIDSRRNTAITFDMADEDSPSYTGQIYWEYLNQLKEACDDYLKGYDFQTRIIINNSLVVIEFYQGVNSKTEGSVPWMTFKLGVTSELNKSEKDYFKELGFYSYFVSKIKLDVPNMVHVIAIKDNLIKQLEIYQVNSTKFNESLNEWRSKVVKTII